MRDSNQIPEACSTATTYGDCDSAESGNVAKTVAISSSDPRLIALVERWDSLPADARDEIIRSVNEVIDSRMLGTTD